jgi:PAS domain S-box-containing protein
MSSHSDDLKKHGISNFDPWFLGTIIDALPVVLFCKNAQHEFTVCNQLYADFIGMPKHEIVGKTTRQLFTEAVANAFDEQNEKLMKSGGVEIEELTLKDGNNVEHIWLLQKTVFRDDQGNIAGVIGTKVDITERKRAQLKLDDQYNLLRTVIDNLPEAIYAKDVDSRYTLANKAMAKSLNCDDPDAVIGKLDADFLRNDQWPKLMALDQKMIRSGDITISEEKIIDPLFHSSRWIHSTRIPLKGITNEINGIVGLNVDITQIKKEIEQSLLLSTALESTTTGILITDRTGLIQYVNTAMQQITGYKYSELIGNNPRLFKSEYHDRLFYQQFWSHILSGKNWKGEFINHRKDGTRFIAGVDINPILNEHNEVTHFVSILTDITEQKQLQDELTRIHAAIEGASNGIVITDTHNKVIYVNPAFTRLSGVTVNASECILLSGLLEPAEVVDKNKLFNFNKGWNHECLLQGANNQSVPVAVRASPVINLNREGVGMAYFIVDLTERKKAELEKSMMEIKLRQAQKLESIGQLAAGVAHEINTPTQFVGDNSRFVKDSFSEMKDFIEILKEWKATGSAPEKLSVLAEPLKQSIAKVDLDYLIEEIPLAIDQSIEGLGRIARIVNAMRMFSHPGSKEFKTINLNSCIESAVTISRNEWKYTADLSTHFDPELPLVTCLVAEFNQVILNLIVNAAHAITAFNMDHPDAKGLITISTHKQGDSVLIKVTDTGTGIPEAIRDRVFDPFFTTKEVGKGTGQGLSIAYDIIVNKHQGDIKFESEVGKGTTFIIQIPISRD